MIETSPLKSPSNTSKGRALTLTTLSLIAVAEPFLAGVILPTLPMLQAELDVTPSLFAGALIASTLAAVVSTPLAGRMADIHGPRRTLLTLIAAVIVGGYLAAFAVSFPVFLIGQVLVGCGFALIPVIFVVLRSSFERRQMTIAAGVVISMITAGEGLGLLLAGPVALSLSRAAMFAIPTTALVLAAVLLLVGRIGTGSDSGAAVGKVPWLGASLLGFGLLAFFAGLNLGPEYGWLATGTLGLLTAGIVLLIVWFLAERRSKNPLVEVGLLRERGVWAPMIVSSVEGATVSATSFLILQRIALPTETGYGLGADVGQTGLFLICGSAAGVISAPLAGRVAAKVGTALVATIGCILLAAGSIWLALFTDATQVIAGLVVVSIGSATAASSVYAATALAVPSNEVGIATALVALARSLGLAVGTQVGAAALADPELPQSAFTLGLFLAAGLSAAGFVASFAFPRDRGVVTEAFPN
ncbi:MFS transporter [Arthrobacter sp. PM3]|uniref:MFS transporter n=1 Tax=Arthrobacter sp. PM3 TaxID=2017685 RepID=UPI000E10D964|nr:MFS transporter [Arthrobacter sp. PM3]AXJ09887.1 hypothetical protein CFN17_09820 [Arthrobacter sp. PM3]